MLYLLNTNAWSDAARGVGRVGRKLSVIPLSQILIASPVLYELRRVPRTAAAWKTLNRFVSDMVKLYEVASFDADAVEAAIDLSVAMRAKGRNLHHLDIMIAGIAIARGATLVTRDKDFASAPRLPLEDWS